MKCGETIMNLPILIWEALFTGFSVLGFPLPESLTICPVKSTASRPGLSEVVVRLVLAVFDPAEMGVN